MSIFKDRKQILRHGKQTYDFPKRKARVGEDKSGVWD